jgi:hypothetical protein
MRSPSSQEQYDERTKWLELNGVKRTFTIDVYFPDATAASNWENGVVATIVETAVNYPNSSQNELNGIEEPDFTIDEIIYAKGLTEIFAIGDTLERLNGEGQSYLITNIEKNAEGEDETFTLDPGGFPPETYSYGEVYDQFRKILG